MDMTNDELLKKAFDSILKEHRENLDHISKDNFEYTDELKEELSDIIAIIEDILPEIDGVASFGKLDQEDYAFMFEQLSEYAETFVVDGTGDDDKLEADTLEFHQLMDIIELLEADYVPQDYEYDEDDEDDE